MKRLLKGGRVVDPANGRDGVFDILIDGDRIAARRLESAGGGRHRSSSHMPSGRRDRAGPDRHARAPARARPGAQGDGRDRHARRP